MPGVRLLHPTARNCRYTVTEGDRPYPVPFTCTPPAVGGCGSVHLFKTHHLNLDETGAVIVSTGVFERIGRRLALDGFAIANEVKAPPPLRVGLARPDHLGGVLIVRSPNAVEPI